MSEENPSMRRILELIRREKRVSKADILKHLGWAPKQRTLSWTAFRKRLKLLAHEDASNPDAIFEWNGNQGDVRSQVVGVATGELDQSRHWPS